MFPSELSTNVWMLGTDLCARGQTGLWLGSFVGARGVQFCSQLYV